MSKLEDDLEEALHGVGFNHFRLCDCDPALSDLSSWHSAVPDGHPLANVARTVLTALEAADNERRH